MESELRAIAAKLVEQHGIDVCVVAKDLERESAAQELYDELNRDVIDVHILVNNAGQGFLGKFWDIPIERDISMLRLNVEAPLRLTKLFVRPMLQREHGRILNTASVAGFQPGPFLNVYHSTKAFLLSWSAALAVELEGTGVSVTALCPGPTDTDFFPKAGMLGTRLFQKGKVAAPQDVAKAGYEALMNGDLFIVPGLKNKMFVSSRRILTERAQARLNRKAFEEVPRSERERERGDIEKESAERS